MTYIIRGRCRRRQRVQEWERGGGGLGSGKIRVYGSAFVLLPPCITELKAVIGRDAIKGLGYLL